LRQIQKVIGCTNIRLLSVAILVNQLFPYQLDMRLGRIIRFGERYRLSLFAEGFNLFNRANVQSVNNALYSYSVVGGAARLTQTPNFATSCGFVSGSPSFTFNSSYNCEFQLGLRFDF